MVRRRGVVGVASVGADARRLFCARSRRVARRAIARILPGEERHDHGAGARTPRFRSQEADERGAVNPYENLTEARSVQAAKD
jgi:hypothetical protein